MCRIYFVFYERVDESDFESNVSYEPFLEGILGSNNVFRKRGKFLREKMTKRK